MKRDFVLKGTIVHAPRMGAVEAVENGYLVVRDGNIEEIAHSYSGDIPVEDFGERLIIPGLCDMHVHAPQYAMRGLGLDMELLPWLEAYTFPEESKFADAEYARRVYTRFAKDLVRQGTTRVCVFGTIHTDTVLMLMDILEEAGISAYVGKVNMDRNAPGALCETTQESVTETLRWLSKCGGKSRHVRPMITPRFVPSCTDGLLQMLGEIAEEYELPVQSHLSENLNELAWVRELAPDCGCYGEVYERFGLFGGEGARTAMAHCVHSVERERELMAKNHVLAVHCPDSNANLASGIANVRGMLRAGVPVALGSDLAGGCTVSILDAMAKAVRASKLSQQRLGEKALTTEEAFFLGTSAGSEFFGQGSGFCKGTPLHAVVLSDEGMFRPRELSVLERLQRMLYLNEDRKIEAVYANGKKIGSQKGEKDETID